MIQGTCVINILAFCLIFLVACFHYIVSISKTVVNCLLKKFDGAAGAGFGIIRGFFIIYLIFALIPVLLVLAPTDIFTELLDGSKLADFFHYTNIFTSFVRGR